jgi:hypothetical protein
VSATIITLSPVMRTLAALTLAIVTGSVHADAPVADTLTCPRPFELQIVRGLDFGRVAVARELPGQVDVEPDGAYRQLGGAYVSIAPAPAEMVFCGPRGARFEVRVESHDGVDAAAPRMPRLAPGSVRTIALGAELHRLNASMWAGEIGDSGRVSLRFGGRLDIPARVDSVRTSVHIPVSLRSR